MTKRALLARIAVLEDANRRMKTAVELWERRAINNLLLSEEWRREANDLRTPGMCPDRATCIRTCSRADAYDNLQKEES